MKKLLLVCFIFFSVFIFYSCGASDSAAENKSGDTGGDYADGPGDTGDTGNTANTGDSADAADTGNTGEVNDESVANDDNETSDEDTTEVVGDLVENPFVTTEDEDTSTFSIDVDTASYSLVRNYLMSYNQMPPVNRVRIEEFVNYFDYDYPQPQDGDPFSVTMEMSQSPWRDDAQLIMFGLQGKEIDAESVPMSNLVFLIDVSGSMSAENKLPLLKKAFKRLVDQLSEKDKISIVTYAGRAAVILDSVSGSEKEKLKTAIDNLSSGGSTAGAEGIITAYELAEKNLNGDGNNRIILATDGDFNVGQSSEQELEDLIVEERDKGIFLTILGFGMGNYQDSKMETLADQGNGNYFYIDTEKEAEKVFVFDLMGNMFTIAKDVKLQIVFNPDKIEKYRLIGYENRVMPNQDFNDDTKDAGEIGSGHRVTAFYEVILTATDGTILLDSDEEESAPTEFNADEYLLLKMRYKEPDQDMSKYMETRMNEDNVLSEMSENFGFSSAVVEFGMLLRRSQFKEESSYSHASDRATKYIGKDTFGYRGEFIEMIQKAKELDK